MKWIRVHFGAAAIVAVFVVFFVIVLVSWQTFGEGNILGRTAGMVVSAVQVPFAKAGAFLEERFSVFFLADDLAAENEELKERIVSLERELMDTRLSTADLAELKRLSEVLNYADLSDDYQLVTANVVALDASSGFNIFTINAGSESGVSDEAVVVDGNGLIGRVLSVGNGWSKVISIIDESNKVGFQVFRSPEWLGVLQGDGSGGLSGYMLDETASVRDGDRLITSGIGGVYPPGLTIGKITEIEWNHDSPLKTIRVEPAAYFKNIRKVTVLI
jgi:rod shape-determining protein MreC